MKITRLSAFRQLQPFRDGPYVCSGGRVETGFDSLLVRLQAADGSEGWGEMAPLGANYDPSFAEGARAALPVLSSVVLGSDATAPAVLARRMDVAMKGHPYAKAAIDMAGGDLLGRLTGLSLAQLTGGADGDSVRLYRSVPVAGPEAMAERARLYVREGYLRLQVKVGNDPREDVERLTAVAAAVGPGIVLFCDANGGWGPASARIFIQATRSLDYVLEQPCATYEQTLAIRGACDRPLVLDETIEDLATLRRALADGLADGITIKIARVGGITKARLIRDVAADAGLMVTVEDTGGAEIDTAAMVLLSLSTPAHLRQHTVDFNNWVTVGNADGLPPCGNGLIRPPTGPGLGLTVREGALGAPIADYQA